MYYQVIQRCIQGLRNLEAWIDKAQDHAAEKRFDVGILMDARLAPDMRELVYQVTSACDYVKAAAARLAGQLPPKHDDTEKTIHEVRERIRKTIAFAESVTEEQLQGARGRKVSVPWKPGKVLTGDDYLVQMTIPNVYFHLTTAYAILRHNGVALTKEDFLGPIDWIDA